MTSDTSAAAYILPSSPSSVAFGIPSNLLSLEHGSDGLSYYVYDASLLQSVLQGIGVNNTEPVTLALTGEDEESLCARDDDQKSKIGLNPLIDHQTQFTSQIRDAFCFPQIKLEEPNLKLASVGLTNGNEITAEQSVLISPTQTVEEPLLPTFYNDMTVSLSNETETHETYLPLSFDEASHFLFHGREECVISTDIPTIETSSSSMASTSSLPNTLCFNDNENGNDDGDTNVEEAKSTNTKSIKPKRQRLNEGETVSTKVFKCPHKDCSFWAKRAHRFHEHMCTHDSIRPFGCSECTYETNWKSDVKKHIARMIERNAKDHENAVLRIVSDHKVDITKYKEYVMTLEVPCYMYSGRIGQPSRASSTNSSSTKKSTSTKLVASSSSDIVSPTSSNDLTRLPNLLQGPSTIQETTNKEDSPTSKKKRKTVRAKPKVKITQLQQGIISNFINTTAPESVPETEQLLQNVQLGQNQTKSTISMGNGSSEESHTSASLTTNATSNVGVLQNGLPLLVLPDFVQPSNNLQETKDASQQLQNPLISPQPQPTKKLNKKLKEPELWKCTNCTFTHSSKTTVLNHLHKFHKLFGALANPTQVASQAQLPTTSFSYTPYMVDTPESPNFIVRGDGDGDSFNQYFLVVDNSFSEPRLGTSSKSDSAEQKCDICPFETKSSYELMKHKECHGSTDENLTYDCSYCNFKTATRKDMEQHKLLHVKSIGGKMKVNDYSRNNTKKGDDEKMSGESDTGS